jgi:hypothetical protein
MQNLKAYQEFNNWCNEKNLEGETRIHRCTKYLTDVEYRLLLQAMQFAFVAGYTRQSKEGQSLHVN